MAMFVSVFQLREKLDFAVLEIRNDKKLRVVNLAENLPNSVVLKSEDGIWVMHKNDKYKEWRLWDKMPNDEERKFKWDEVEK